MIKYVYLNKFQWSISSLDVKTNYILLILAAGNRDMCNKKHHAHLLFSLEFGSVLFFFFLFQTSHIKSASMLSAV